MNITLFMKQALKHYKILTFVSDYSSSVIRQKGESQNVRVRIRGLGMFVFRKIWRALFS